ncbi:rod-binding protein [Kordiimonas aestuarii]|uniref:rod-binding protein n=1 Tax=Kordiimonas aestuarii TaxID=1005925 RepID=UPI0021D2A3D9|nr:rod-binding protein [Kordiimonas aestuarii]
MQPQMINTAQTNAIEAQLAAAREGIGKVGSNLSDAQKAKARDAAEQFEAIFIAQMLNPMFETIETDSLMGGGPAEGVYRSMMVEEASKSIASKGGIGIADNVYRELLKMQEV